MVVQSNSVLLIDDDPHTTAIFELLMENHQIPYAVTDDVVSALDYLQQNSPGVIIIDLFLPNNDGFQVLNQISTLVDRADCRILATTAYYTKDTRNEVINRGFDGYIPKPFLPDSIIEYLYDA